MRFSRNQILFAGVFLAGGAAVAGLSLRGEPKRQVKADVAESARPKVGAMELAQWIVDGRRDFAVVDMRSAKDYTAGHIRGAVNCGSCHESKENARTAMHGAGFVDLSKKLVLYTETGKETIALPKLIAENKRLYVLDGGYAAWRAEVLAPVVYGGEADEAELAAKRQRESVRGLFTGERPTQKMADLPVTPIRRENAHRPAGTSEGC